MKSIGKVPVSAEETEGAVPAVNALAELCVDETDGAECAVAAVAAVPVALRALAAEGADRLDAAVRASDIRWARNCARVRGTWAGRAPAGRVGVGVVVGRCASILVGVLTDGADDALTPVVADAADSRW